MSPCRDWLLSRLQLAADAIRAVQFLQEEVTDLLGGRIAHCDLKSQNWLVDCSLADNSRAVAGSQAFLPDSPRLPAALKLADFGEAIVLHGNGKDVPFAVEGTLASPAFGTPEWMAPERHAEVIAWLEGGSSVGRGAEGSCGKAVTRSDSAPPNIMPGSASQANRGKGAAANGDSKYWLVRYMSSGNSGTREMSATSIDLCAADVFSLGVVLWEIVAVADPLAGLPRRELMRRVVAGERPHRALVQAGFAACDSMADGAADDTDVTSESEPMNLLEVVEPLYWAVLERCWDAAATNRPKPSEVHKSVQDIADRCGVSLRASADVSTGGHSTGASSGWMTRPRMPKLFGSSKAQEAQSSSGNSRGWNWPRQKASSATATQKHGSTIAPVDLSGKETEISPRPAAALLSPAFSSKILKNFYGAENGNEAVASDAVDTSG
eukprot:SAG31_NODE_828_length_11716_cov_4.405785_6_plen_437_part_00